jgi:hypothetical protein
LLACGLLFMTRLRLAGPPVRNPQARALFRLVFNAAELSDARYVASKYPA